MKTAKQIHEELKKTGLSSKEAAQVIADTMGKSYWTVYGWIGDRPPPADTLELLNIKINETYPSPP